MKLNLCSKTRKVIMITFLFFGVFAIHAQNKEITGKVTDESGMPLPGASVLEKGTTNGDQSDFDGNFSLNLRSSNAILIVSYIGYTTKEVVVGTQTKLMISLSENTQSLDEIVVVGYGSQKKSDITGAISSADTEQMQRIITNDLGKMLVGRVAGLDVVAANGRPGSTSEIRIRGTRSLSADNSPLYVVDGVPFEDITSVNLADIASVEVLKDAASTAIYGARAANGVVLITTKRGTAGKTEFSFAARQSIQSLKRNFDFFSNEEYVQLQRDVFRLDDGTYPADENIFQPYEIPNLNSGQFTDWENLTIGDSFLKRYDASVSTGTEKSRTRLSLGIFDQDGMIANSDFQQINARLNTDFKISDNFSVGASIAYNNSDQSIEEEFIEGYLSLSPLTSPFDSEGNLVPTLGDGGQSNPLWNNTQYSNNRKRNDYLLNLFTDWKIIPSLNYRFNISLNNNFSNSKQYRTSLHQIGSNTNGVGTLNTTESKDFLIENILTYNKDFDKFGKFDITLVQSMNELRTESISISATQFPTDAFGADGISGALAPGQPQKNISQRRILSYMGRVNYNYKDRYLVSFTGRIDGSSVFGANQKYAYLPSGAISWLAHNESFLADVDWLSQAKLRLSYGKVGSQGVTPYRTLGVTDEYFYKFGNLEPSYSALPSSELYNPNLKWEVSESTNIGLDLSLFKNKLNLTAEYYNTLTNDLIVRRRIDASLGYTSQFDNLGSVRNKGLELTANYNAVNTKDFNWNISATFTKNKNEILKISGDLDEEGNPVDEITNNWFIGESINVYFDYKFDGIWQETDDIANSYMPDAKPGDIRVVDVNGDGEITQDDRIIINRDPKFLASFTSEMTYKNFDLSADFFWRNGGRRYNGNYGGNLGGSGSNGMRVDYWTPENPSNNFPKPRQNFIPFTQTYQYQDASFFRLRNLTIGYTFSDRIIDKLGITNLRLYTSMTNIWTVTDYLSYGPEHSSGDYPEPQTFEFGINLNF